MSWREELEQILHDHGDELRTELEVHAQRVRPGTWLHDSLNSPDPRGPVRGVLALLQAVCQ